MGKRTYLPTYRQCNDIATEISTLKETVSESLPIDNTEVLEKLNMVMEAWNNVDFSVKKPPVIKYASAYLSSSNASTSNEVDIINITGSGKLYYALTRFVCGSFSTQHRGGAMTIYIDGEKKFVCGVSGTTSSSSTFVSKYILVCPYYYLTETKDSTNTYLQTKQNFVDACFRSVEVELDYMDRLKFSTSNTYHNNAQSPFLRLCPLTEEISFKSSLRITLLPYWGIDWQRKGTSDCYVAYSVD